MAQHKSRCRGAEHGWIDRTYATNIEKPAIPFWPMVFKNIRLLFLGSDDFPSEAKMQAARDLNSALEAGWSGFEIAEQIRLCRDRSGSRSVRTSGTAGAGGRRSVNEMTRRMRDG